MNLLFIVAINHEARMVKLFFKVKKQITITTIAVIEAVNIWISIILFNIATMNELSGLKSFKFFVKINLTKGSNKKRDRIEKKAAAKLHQMIT